MVKCKEIQELEKQAKNDQYWLDLGKRAARNEINWQQVFTFGLVFFLAGLSAGVIISKYFSDGI